MKTCNEKELLDWIRDSDYAAYEELHHRFWKPLYIHAVKKTGSKEDAFDLVQDLFTELWDKRSSLPQIDAPLKYYLRSSIVFKIATYFRTKGFQEKHEKNYEAFLQQEHLVASEISALQLSEDHAAFDDLIAAINSTIDTMPDKMRHIFLMSRSGEYSIADIANSLELSQQTVKNQISNALQRLRKATASSTLGVAEASFLYWLFIS